MLMRKKRCGFVGPGVTFIHTHTHTYLGGHATGVHEHPRLAVHDGLNELNNLRVIQFSVAPNL